MTTTERGRQAETVASDHLAAQGHQILGRNWRNRWCEIDIITRYEGAIHFVEVKYRRNTNYGYAAEYISSDKASRLRRAALAWNQAHGYAGPYQIGVVTVEGELAAPVIGYIPNAVSD